MQTKNDIFLFFFYGAFIERIHTTYKTFPHQKDYQNGLLEYQSDENRWWKAILDWGGIDEVR